MNQLVFQANALDQLLGALSGRGFRLIGPVVRDDTVVYDDITSAADLPAGWADDQDAGRYRQWATHKLATWEDQFGTPGWVGCGRCCG